MMDDLLIYKSCLMNGDPGGQRQLEKVFKNLKKVLDKRNKLC